MRNVALFFLATLGVASSSNAALADMATSDWGYIVFFETGWRADTISITLDVPTVSPTNPSCVKDGGYALDPGDPGVRVHEAAIMGAYFSGHRVRFVVNGCAFNKPKIIAVGVQN